MKKKLLIVFSHILPCITTDSHASSNLLRTIPLMIISYIKFPHIDIFHRIDFLTCFFSFLHSNPKFSSPKDIALKNEVNHILLSRLPLVKICHTRNANCRILEPQCRCRKLSGFPSGWSYSVCYNVLLSIHN